MFTGIVEAVGSLTEVKGLGGGFRIRVSTPLAPAMTLGDSLAVNGVCLTVILVDGDHVLADIGPETARITTLGELQRGQAVNLERPLRADGRLGGHFVLGHVDGVGVVEEVRPDAGSQWLTIGFEPHLAPLFIRKGSVAVDGVSLTVAGLGNHQFDVQVVPYTWANTSLKGLRKRSKVNLECDMVGKYIVRAMELRAEQK
jgi:riboflavin synthase